MATITGAARRRLLAGNRALMRTFEQVERYSQEWEAANQQALVSTGPLWVVLGDSAALAVGATGHDRGYVGLVRRALTDRDEMGWRVVNLAVSGARTRDVLNNQLPRLSQLPAPNLVTAVVGGNDLIGTPLRWWCDDVEALGSALPARSVMATVPQGFRQRKALRANAVIREVATRHGHGLADVWAMTGPPWRGAYADGMHPSGCGYRSWATAVARAVGADPVGPALFCR